MKTVFFLPSSNRPSNQAQLDGILRAAKAFSWNVRVIEFGMASPSHRPHDSLAEFRDNFRKMREFWNPIGLIVDSGAAPNDFRKDEFGIPTVFLDRHPNTLGRGAVCVYSDAKGIAQLAARELLALNGHKLCLRPLHGQSPLEPRTRLRRDAPSHRNAFSRGNGTLHP